MSVLVLSLLASAGSFVGEWRDVSLGPPTAVTATLTVQADGSFVVWKHSVGMKRCRVSGRLVERDGEVAWLDDGLLEATWKRKQATDATDAERAAARDELATFCDVPSLALSTVKNLDRFRLAPWGREMRPTLFFVEADQFSMLVGPVAEYFVFRRTTAPEPDRRRPRWVIRVEAANDVRVGTMTVERDGAYKVHMHDGCEEKGAVSLPPPAAQTFSDLTFTRSKGACIGATNPLVTKRWTGSSAWHPTRPTVDGRQVLVAKTEKLELTFYSAP